MIPSVAWIRHMEEGWLRMNYECSAEGFSRRGWNVKRFEDLDYLKELGLQEGEIIHGPIEDVHKFIDTDFIVKDYPKPLHPFLKRDIGKTTLGEVRGEMDIFVKPVERKLFTGFQPIEKYEWSMARTHPDDTEVYVSEVVDFESEYRVYVGEGEIYHIGRYRGNPEVFPDIDTVKDMIDTWDESPAAYAMDVGVVNGETMLVEVNPMMTSGVYGIDPVALAQLLELIWEEYWS